jgi:adenylate cyclase
MEPAGPARVERRLAAILAADVAGYSRLIEADEEGTLGRLKALRAEIIDPKIAGHKGRIVKTTGDGLLVEFASVVDALRCAAELQVALAEGNASIPPDRRIEFRIGINMGDIVVEDGGIFGDGVNVAARLEGLAEPGGICVSARVQEDATGRLDLAFEDIGEQALKNISRPVRVYRVGPKSPLPDPSRPESRAPLRPSGGRGRGPRSGRVRWAAPRTGTSAPLTQPSPPGQRGERVKSASFEPNFGGKPSERFSPESPAQAGEGNAPGAQVGAAQPPVLALPDKPSIAVLPFQNMSGDPEQEYFADGMVEEIITALSRIRWLFVIARNSTFTYKGRAVDVKQVSRELGVRYILEGSVRKGGNRVRITAQLIDATNGAHLWADRFDGLLEDVFELQDKVAISVAGVIEPTLRQSEIERAWRKRPDSLDAYDLYLRALPFAFASMPQDADKALGFLERAIEREPDYAAAHAMIAYCHEVRYLRAGLREETKIAALRHARIAIATGGDDAAALATSAFVIAVIARDYKTAVNLLDRSFALSNSSAWVFSLSSIIRAWMGDSTTAVKQAEQAIRLSPFDPLIWMPYVGLAYAHFAASRFDETAAAASRVIQSNPGFSVPYILQVGALVSLGRTDDARAVVHRLVEVQPDITYGTAVATSAARYANPENRSALENALRKAGLPEE